MTRRDWFSGALAAGLILCAIGTGTVYVQGQEAAAQQVGSSSLFSPPLPADAVPPSEMLGGQVGSTERYAREDHTHPRITRSAVVTTDASGNWSVTWSSTMAATPVVLPIAINPGSTPISCNVITRTTTGSTGRCWTASSGALLNLGIVTTGLTVVPYGNSAAGVSVQIIAIPPTQ